MMTLFARGGSLAALAAALALTLPATPAAAQAMPEFQPDESDPPGVRVERPSRGADFSGGPAIVQYERPAPQPRSERPAPQPRYERPEPPRYEPVAAAGVAAEPERPASRGFGADAMALAQPARQAETRRGDRAGWNERRGDQRADRAVERSEQRADRVDRRGDARADRSDWRGRGAPAGQVDRPGDTRVGRIEDRGARRGGRIEDRGDARTGRVDGRRNDWRGERPGGFSGRVGEIARDARRAEEWRDRRRDDWRDGRRDGWRDGRRDDWRDGRRDGWRDGRRDDWRDGRRDGWRDDRRAWRRDDWRWGWNGRPGWDSRDFRRWNRGWRSNRSFDWFDFRRGNRFLFQPGPYFAPFRSHRYSRVDIGFFLDSLFFQPRFFINDPWAYRLPPVYGPYQWVRYYDDVVLVDIYTGEVVDVIHDFFW